MKLNKISAGVATLSVIGAFAAGFNFGYIFKDGPEPCFRSMHSDDVWLAKVEQDYLESTDPYPPHPTHPGDKLDPYFASGNALIKRVINDEGTWLGNDPNRTSIWTDDVGREYLVPGYCYVGATTWGNKPILYRKDKF